MTDIAIRITFESHKIQAHTLLIHTYHTTWRNVPVLSVYGILRGLYHGHNHEYLHTYLYTSFFPCSFLL